MKKLLIALVVGLLVVCGIGGYFLRKTSDSKSDPSKRDSTATVVKGDVVVTVVETGTVDATKTVEVKSRVSGRLAKLLVDEGDHVIQGQLIAVIDPKETQLQVDQNAAQLRGATSAVDRQDIEIRQRRITAVAAYEQAKARVRQLRLESAAQPELTSNAIKEAQIALNVALEDRRLLIESTQPNERTNIDASLVEAKANYDQAKKEYDRQVGLREKGYVAGKAVENAETSLSVARARLKSAQDQEGRLESRLRSEKARADQQVQQARTALATAKANSIQVSTKREDLATAINEEAKARAALQDVDTLIKSKEQSQATVSQLSAVLSDAQRQLGETEVRAPIPGVVTKKMLQVGELASGLSGFSAGTSILRIEDRRSMRVLLNVNEIDVAKMAVGMEASIDVDAIPEKSFKGRIKRIAPASKDTGSATAAASTDAVVKYEVEIVVVDPNERLRSGMSAKCSVDVLRRTGVLTLPIEYIERVGRKTYVYLPPADPKVKGAKPEKREVTLGAQTGSKVEVLSGLKEGDKVQKPQYHGPARTGFMQAGPEDE